MSSSVVMMMVSEGPIPYPTLAAVRTLVPVAILVAATLARIPPIRKVLQWMFTDTFPLADVPSDVDPKVAKRRAAGFAPASYLQPAMAFLNSMELLVWTVVFGAELADEVNSHTVGLRTLLLSAGMVLIWLILTLRTVVRPPVTPPGTTLSIYVALFFTSATVLVDAGNARLTFGQVPPWATQEALILEALNFTTTLALFLLAAQLRFSTPAALGRAPVLANDDVVNVWQWMTFNWMNPLINYASKNELQPEDLPALSPTLQAANLHTHFLGIFRAHNSLVAALGLANRFDLVMDCSFTLVSVALNYSGPYLLGKILAAVQAHSNGEQGALAEAYTYALIAFTATVLKAISDCMHLFAGRRAGVRIKAGLIATLCDKALRRKDASGVITAKEGEEPKNAAPKDPKDPKTEKEEVKTSADTGKVMSLVSVDVNKLSYTAPMLFMIWQTPFELVIASVMLYKSLGWSAFAGLFAVVIATPINSIISNRAVAIQKDLLKARDKRLGVMTELISAITFIKFFAWEGRWMKRATDAREGELKQMRRSILNNLMFSLLWSVIPILVSLFAFASFIVIAHGELTVERAFPAIALFQMLRIPLNALPMFYVWLLQAKVSCDRIQEFLGEDEVPDWVSSLKRVAAPATATTKIGFSKATLRWNTGKQSEQPGAITTTTTNNNNGGGQSASEPANTNGGESSDTAAADSSTVASVEVFELTDLNIEFPVHKLTILSGPTGAGKTAVLVGLLGEMELLSGEVFLPKNLTQIDPETGFRNSVAYAAQTPWLQQMSIRDNILFGEPFDQDRYDKVVDACALRTDFNILEDGDDTEIGAKGVSLSGGQKARVALARAVYSYAQHVLLDDPLAAVDSHTAKHLVETLLSGPLLKGRTVILVSHHLELLLPIADYIVRIVDGRVDCQGTPDFLKSNNELDGVVAIESAEATKAEIVAAEAIIADDADAAASDDDKPKEKKKGPARKLVKDEERALGNVKWETYRLYIEASTYITLGLWVMTLVLQQVVSVGELIWLKIWGEAYNTRFVPFFAFSKMLPHQPAHVDYRDHFLYPSHDGLNASAAAATSFVVQGGGNGAISSPKWPSATNNPGFYLTVYTGIMLLSAIVSIVQSVVAAWGGYLAGKTLHERLLERVVHGTVRFFTTTPSGRLVNRFANDTEKIDTRVSSSVRTVVIYAVAVVIRIAVVAWNVPAYLVPAIIILFLYYYYTVLYLRTGRSLRRLEATSNSPIFSSFAEILDGVITVRAFSAEHRFFDKMCTQVDLAMVCFWNYWMANRWLLMRFDVLGGINVFLTSIMVLVASKSAGSLGVVITAAQSVSSSVYWASRYWGEMEMDLNSVERVQEYLELPQEPPAIIEDHRPPASWPTYESPNTPFISAENLKIKYDPSLPTVFEGSFDIMPREKIGLIGRTGSGKSTLAMSMLRFADPAGGKLVIDGIDITTIGVEDLRSRITYIPQDAVLFSGTVRENLDPFNEHTDAELIEALTRVNLISETVPPSRIDSRAPSGSATPSLKATAAAASAPAHPRLIAIAAENAAHERGAGSAGPSGTNTPRVQIGLSTELSKGGENISLGQRQLIAMARAQLRRSNLVIMDEATSAVDFQTDAIIQKAIRTEFKESTVITVAHRLETVIDYDRLLILGEGRVIEFDTPINLLRKDSLFKTMCEKSGKYSTLYRAAERKDKGVVADDDVLVEDVTEEEDEPKKGDDEGN